MEKTDSVYEIQIEEPPRQRHEKNIYIDAVRDHFVAIQRLRENHYSFIQICGALVRDKKLPEDVQVRYFRQAFRRECLRQEKICALAKLLNDAPKPATAKKLVEKTPEKPDTQANDATTLEKERLMQKVGGRRIETLNVIITRFTDGSFNFD